jgi:uncharacterized protein YgiM (DUF1202 family)
MAGYAIQTVESQTARAGNSYSYDFFRITKVNFDSVQAPTDTSFDSIKNYYNILKRLSHESVDSGNNWAQNDLNTFLRTNGGMSRAQANQQITFLNSNGNTFLYFVDAEKGSDYWIFLYLER